ncbi:MAG: hypothetical protein HOW97_23970 [Catenulispora sp.]|nr:hypothetical protein [Catenulispora sp.]
MTQDGDPDDATLIAALDVERSDAWRALMELDEDFRNRPHAPDDCVWQERYPQYGARVETARRLLVELGAVTPLYHWMQRKPPVLGADGTVSPADAVRLATTVIRSERFGDGNIAGALTAGILQATVAALAGWYREQAG